jgi:hypothetical protein
MGQILANEIPIFAGLRFMFAGAKPQNKTVLSVIREDKVTPALNILKKILGGLDQPGTGIVFILPLDRVEGLMPEI